MKQDLLQTCTIINPLIQDEICKRNRPTFTTCTLSSMVARDVLRRLGFGYAEVVLTVMVIHTDTYMTTVGLPESDIVLGKGFLNAHAVVQWNGEIYDPTILQAFRRAFGWPLSAWPPFGWRKIGAKLPDWPDTKPMFWREVGQQASEGIIFEYSRHPRQDFRLQTPPHERKEIANAVLRAYQRCVDNGVAQTIDLSGITDAEFEAAMTIGQAPPIPDQTGERTRQFAEWRRERLAMLGAKPPIAPKCSPPVPAPSARWHPVGLAGSRTS